MRSQRRGVLGFSFVLGALVAAASCSSTPAPANVAEGCSINSDCDKDLICAFGKCHVACRTSRDCTGETCLPPSGVCELEQETPCSDTLPCVVGLTCANDICRAPCSPDAKVGSTGGCLASQSCVAGTKKGQFVCIDSKGSGSGDGAAGDDGGGGDDGSTGDGGGGTSDATMSDATMSDAKGEGSKGDTGPSGDGNPCVDPQLTFGNIGQGDSNKNFTSGVGVRTDTDLYIFNGYTGPDPAGDGGGPTVGFVYVQAFDATTAKSKGPAKEFFPAPGDTNNVTVVVTAAAVAPTGQIALLSTDTYRRALFVTFLDSASDGGVAGLQFLQTVTLSHGARLSDPEHVIWSNASHSIFESWSGANYFESVAKFTATGGQTAGGVASVTTDQGSTTGEPNNSGGASAGQSGDLLGVEWRSSVQNSVGLTAFNALGDQVGSYAYFGTFPGSNGPIADTLAGTAQGFVGVYTYNAATTEVFVPNSVFVPDGGLPDAGAFRTVAIPGSNALQLHAVGDDVATGGAGGVGVAQLFTSSVSFAYVHADGLAYDGPVSVFGNGANSNNISQVSVMNINGSFVVTLFAPMGSGGVPATQIAASGCP